MAHSLSYSTYLPSQPNSPTVWNTVAGNRAGDSCVFGEAIITKPDESFFVTRLRADGSVVYSTLTFDGSPIPGGIQIAID
jgi:hypothetical protein